MNRLLRSTFQFISALVIVLTFLSYLAPEIDPALFQGLVFFGTAFPWLLLANILLLLFWAWQLNRFTFYHLGIILLGWEYVTGFVGFNMGSHPAPESALTVATHNLGRIWSYKMSDDQYRALATSYARYLRKAGQPDILCTQETRTRFHRLLAKELDYPYSFNLKKGTVIFSKYPITASGEIPFEETTNTSMWADIKVGDKIVRLYNVHLQSNRVTTSTEKVLEEGELAKEETWSDIKRILRKVGGATRLRADQARRLRAHMASSKYPVLVCGDLNDTPNSYVYRHLSDGLSDTFREKGLGLGTTFAGALPLLRIDYILNDPKIRVYDCRVYRKAFSDHFPVIATLEL